MFKIMWVKLKPVKNVIQIADNYGVLSLLFWKKEILMCHYCSSLCAVFIKGGFLTLIFKILWNWHVLRCKNCVNDDDQFYVLHWQWLLAFGYFYSHYKFENFLTKIQPQFLPKYHEHVTLYSLQSGHESRVEVL